MGEVGLRSWSPQVHAGDRLANKGPSCYVVFCTAHAEHAVEAFDAEALDYLLKPVEAERLEKALQRDRPAGSPSDQPRRARRRAGALATNRGDVLTDLSLQELEGRLPSSFMRVHRRALLNLERMARLEPTETGEFLARTARGDGVQVSRQAARQLRRRLGLRRPAEEREEDDDEEWGGEG
ncbi:MAG: LytTR family transcriptional regulator DNA-binding domain-containing protein [Deltaproteobacteria bacterium]|nr:LytTR family transcriptional regulator DNA-binding domain-containing protein [Deltaproteobacteria bacterium]